MKDNPLVLSPAVEWGFFFWGMICSRAASGPAASSVMRSRRFIIRYLVGAGEQRRQLTVASIT
jgi:hypothetical protein